jgi:drug/metabolite transporter (DMT)-like permease
VWAALVILYFVWGSTYLGILFAIESIPPYVMGALRFVLAGGALLAWSVARNPRQWPSRRELVDSFIVGALLLGGAMGLVAVAEQSLPSGVAALLVALLPAWLVIFGRVFVGERITRPVAIGIAVGLVGVAILAGPWEATGNLDPFGVVAILGSPILWSLGSIYSAHRAAPPSDPVRSLAIQMLAGSLVMFVLAVIVGDLARFDAAAVTSRSLLAIGYLAVIGSLVGYSTYIWLIRHAPLAKVGTYAYVNPVVAFGLGALLAGEPITLRTLVAAVVIVVAVAMIVTARSRAAGEAILAPAEGDGATAEAAGDNHEEAGRLTPRREPSGQPAAPRPSP